MSESGDGRIDLSVIIPAFNEERRLPATLSAVHDYLCGKVYSHEVLVVDDGSQDGTVSLVTEWLGKWPELRLLQQTRNQGKGAAVRAGMLAAQGRWRLFSDADLSTPIEELATLRLALGDSGEVAIASRALPESRVEVPAPPYRQLMGRTYNSLVRRLLLAGIRDTQCGFKLFSAQAALVGFGEPLNPRFGFDVESLVRVKRAGIDVVEVPVTWRNAPGSTVSSLRDGLSMFFEVFRLKWRESQQPRAHGSLADVEHEHALDRAA